MPNKMHLKKRMMKQVCKRNSTLFW